MILMFYNIEKNSFYQRHKFWMQINIFDIFDVFLIFNAPKYHLKHQQKVLRFKFPMILKIYNIKKIPSIKGTNFGCKLIFLIFLMFL